MDRVVWPWQMSGNMGDMASDDFDDIPLEPEEELDSDEVRNDDGDEVVDPPEEWIEAKDNETLDERLAEEVPDDLGDDEDEAPSDAHDSGWSATTTSTTWTWKGTAANADRSMAHRRTGTRSTT